MMMERRIDDARSKVELKWEDEQASTITALKEQLAGARNAALAEVSALFPQPYMEYFGENIQGAIRALTSQPAAPVQPEAAPEVPSENPWLRDSYLLYRLGAHGYNVDEIVVAMVDGSRNHADRAAAAAKLHAMLSAPPVQQPDDVRDLHAEIMSVRADVSNCSITGASAEIGYKQGHRDARHAAAELVASVEHEALATARPGAALTNEKIAEIDETLYSKAFNEGRPTYAAIDFARAILAASGGAEPVVPEWISVDDRLPELHVAVALLNDDTFMNTGGDFDIHWQAAGWLCEHGHKYWSVIGESRAMTLDSVTHWMPLPPAPSEQSAPAGSACQGGNTKLDFTNYSAEVISTNNTAHAQIPAQPAAAPAPTDSGIPISDERGAFDSFMLWADQNLGQGYSLEREDGTFLDPVTRWAFKAWQARGQRQAGVPEHLRKFVEYLAEGITIENRYGAIVCECCGADNLAKHKPDCIVLRANAVLAAAPSVPGEA